MDGLSSITIWRKLTAFRCVYWKFARCRTIKKLVPKDQLYREIDLAKRNPRSSIRNVGWLRRRHVAPRPWPLPPSFRRGILCTSRIQPDRIHPSTTPTHFRAYRKGPRHSDALCLPHAGLPGIPFIPSDVIELSVTIAITPGSARILPFRFRRKAVSIRLPGTYNTLTILRDRITFVQT